MFGELEIANAKIEIAIRGYGVRSGFHGDHGFNGRLGGLGDGVAVLRYIDTGDRSPVRVSGPGH
jgi:hypothetical protein